MGFRCVFEYGDGERCTYRGCEIKGDMCDAHATLVDSRIKAYARRKHYNRFYEPYISYHDTTTPWHCGNDECTEHAGKPTYNEYMSKYQFV